MNKTIFMLIFLQFSPLIADMACMEKGWHLQKKFDSKEYHLVKNCDCPCGKKYKILADRGKCTKCQHYREDFQPYIIIQSSQAKKVVVKRYH